MKASKLHSIWIIIQSSATLLYYSARTILTQLFGKTKRQNVDYFGKRLCYKLCQYIQLTYDVHDPYHLMLDPNRRYIVMCNHSSLYDIPLSFASVPGSLRMVVKKELFKVPIWGRAMKMSDFICLDRGNKDEAKKALIEAKEKMQSGIIIWMAPEGTRSRTGKLQPFKKGGFLLAYQTDAIIIPLAIKGSFDILPPKTINFQLGRHVDIYLGKPIDIRNYKIKDRPQLMKDVENGLNEFLNNKDK